MAAGCAFARKRQVEIEDALLVLLVVGLLGRDEEPVAQDGPREDCSVGSGHEEFGGDEIQRRAAVR